MSEVIYVSAISVLLLITMFLSILKPFMGQHMRLWYLSPCWASKAQASMRNCSDSAEPSLLILTKYWCNEDSDQNAELYSSAGYIRLGV